MIGGCSIGIMAHNEERNIGSLLAALVNSAISSEIVVVASGCTDRTESIVRSWQTRDKRIHLIVQETREGKASAVNAFLRHTKERVVVLCSADLIPDHGTIERLLEPFGDPEVGMTSARPVPVNDPATFMGFAAHLLWELHHQLNLSGQFKAGELIAFRKIFERI